MFKVLSSRATACVPAHLRRFVVEQDYAQYTEIDHAVWRFVLLQTYARLRHTAHPAYKTGLSATGIDIERIPRVEEMNEKLSRFGWGAVCVDGFIPPRAFQSFQANRILPIAADMRSFEHLAYTPAPDIIHEAAGHAPILSEPAYAHYIEQIGKISEKAFANPADRAVYRAIYELSVRKEHPASNAAQIESAERALAQALRQVTEVSEATRLARLYWWTAEYGLVGSVDDYRLYGAGLLSSLGESASCHAASVCKLPLTAACVEVDYDITREQPQLFVARDFEHLLEVLEEVSRGLAVRTGGAHALGVAQKSEELATLGLDTGLDVVGVVSSFELCEGAPCMVHVSGRPALLRAGALSSDLCCPNEYVVPIGAVAGGPLLSALSPEALARYVQGDRLSLTLRSGVRVTGVLREVRARAGRVEVLLVEGFEVALPSGKLFRSQSRYPLALAGALEGVCAGAPDAYFGATEPSNVRVPKPRWFTQHQRKLLSLYEQAADAHRGLKGAALVDAFERIGEELDRDYPDDWLLRWNLFESLVKAAEQGPLSGRLEAELERLEIAYQYQQPIQSGLTYVRSIAEGRSTD